METFLLVILAGGLLGFAFRVPGKPWLSGLRGGCAWAAVVIAVKVFS